MKFLFVIDHFGSGGAQRQLTMLAKALAGKGVEVDFFIYYPKHDFHKETITSAGIKVFSSSKGGRFSIAPVFSLTKLIRCNKYNAVLSFLNTPSFYAELATLLTFKKTPLFISERSSYLEGQKPTFGTWFRESFHRVAHLIICNSYYQKNNMLRRYDWLENKVVTILNGVDTEEFTPPCTLSMNKKLLVVARVDQGKNALNLAKALKHFRDKNSWCPHLTWVGKEDPMPNSQKYIKEVKNFIAENSLENNWKWKGECFDVPKIMKEHHALIHPSFYEGFPNAVCEALSSGLPVIISDVNDNSILADNNNNGFLFDPSDFQSISLSIEKFFNLTESEMITYSKNCRKFAEDKLSIEQYAGQYLDILSK